MNFGHVGYIPAYIRHHPDLNAVTKLVYAEITANIEMQGYCKKKNSFFAKVLGSSASTISACITKLRRFNLIKVVIENEEDTNKFINRYIMLTLPEISVGVNNDVPTKKGQVVINKVINEKQLNYLKNIVNNFYTIQSTNFAEIVKRDWHKDSNLTSGSINVLFDLITLDKWDDSKVRDVINWIVKDSFWASKCYSLRVLRDKAPNGQSKFTNMYASYIDKMKGRG